MLYFTKFEKAASVQKDNNKNCCCPNNYQPIFTFFLLKQWNNWFINYFWGALVAEDLESLMEAERRRLISSWRRTLASFCRWANNLAYSAADSLRFKHRVFFNARRCLLRCNHKETINCSTIERHFALFNLTQLLYIQIPNTYNLNTKIKACLLISLLI